MHLKKTFTKYLLVAAIILLVVNVTIDIVKRPSKKEIDSVRELTTNQIDSVFLRVLKEYGIEDEWVSTKKIKVAYEDSITKQFIVKLPADLSIPLIIKDVNGIIQNDITGFVSEEKKIFGTTEIRIYTNEILKLKATLVPDVSVVRDQNELCFVISDVYDLNAGRFSEFLSIPFDICGVMIPGDSYAVQADSLKKYSKEYIVLLNDENTETKFRLEKDDQKALIKNSVYNVVAGFKDVVLFCIDEQSKLFNSTFYNFVRDDFLRRGIKLVHKSEFLQITSDNDEELISKFRYHCDDKSGSRQKIFFISFDEFQKLQNELSKFRKKGSRIISLSSTGLTEKSKKVINN